MEDKRDILEKKRVNFRFGDVEMKAKPRLLWRLNSRSIHENDEKVTETFPVDQSPYLVVISHSSVCSSVSQKRGDYQGPSIPRVFGKVFSNNCARSGSLSRDFISWITFYLQHSVNSPRKQKHILILVHLDGSARECTTSGRRPHVR